MSQSDLEYESITCSSRKARGNAWVQVVIGFGFASPVIGWKSGLSFAGQSHSEVM